MMIKVNIRNESKHVRQNKIKMTLDRHANDLYEQSKSNGHAKL